MNSWLTIGFFTLLYLLYFDTDNFKRFGLSAYIISSIVVVVMGPVGCALIVFQNVKRAHKIRSDIVNQTGVESLFDKNNRFRLLKFVAYLVGGVSIGFIIQNVMMVFVGGIAGAFLGYVYN